MMWTPTEPLKVGDTVSVKGMMIPIANPDRRWWQFWKPRMVPGPQPQIWRITQTSTSYTGDSLSH